ncbi:MAG: hypothetical protein ACRDK2_15955 [Solirubrobacteraceae bacterium]
MVYATGFALGAGTKRQVLLRLRRQLVKGHYILTLKYHGTQLHETITVG